MQVQMEVMSKHNGVFTIGMWFNDKLIRIFTIDQKRLNKDDSKPLP